MPDDFVAIMTAMVENGQIVVPSIIVGLYLWGGPLRRFMAAAAQPPAQPAAPDYSQITEAAAQVMDAAAQIVTVVNAAREEQRAMHEDVRVNGRTVDRIESSVRDQNDHLIEIKTQTSKR